MARLLDDLLDVSRITRNRIDIRRQVFDVCGSSRDAIDAVRPLCDGRGHELLTDLPGEPLWIDGDPARLQQILSRSEPAESPTSEPPDDAPPPERQQG